MKIFRLVVTCGRWVMMPYVGPRYKQEKQDGQEDKDNHKTHKDNAHHKTAAKTRDADRQ
jgi:hypothetical protein